MCFALFIYSLQCLVGGLNGDGRIKKKNQSYFFCIFPPNQLYGAVPSLGCYDTHLCGGEVR